MVNPSRLQPWSTLNWRTQLPVHGLVSYLQILTLAKWVLQLGLRVNADVPLVHTQLGQNIQTASTLNKL